MYSEKREIVVFIVRKDTQCSKCKQEIFAHNFIYLKEGQPFCLSCAGLEHLVYLPSGDVCITRRSIKHSTIYAVVVKWSRTRKRYERQGVLVEDEALKKAEEECLADAEERKRRKELSAIKLEKLDREYIEKFAKKN